MFQVAADNNCLYRSILVQVAHDKSRFSVKDLRKQVALYILENFEIFYPMLQHDLQREGESFESYIRNVASGEVWGDNVIMAAIVKMWNISISLLSPVLKLANGKPVLHNVYHDKKKPQVILVMNGGDSESSVPNTHFSGTMSKDKNKNTIVGYGRPKKELHPKNLHDVSEGEKRVHMLIAKKATEKTLADHANIAQYLCELKKKRATISKRLKTVEKETRDCEKALSAAESIMTTMNLEFTAYQEVSLLFL